MDTNSLCRFSDRVDNYVKYRPTYPAAIIEFLVAELGLRRESIVVDAGSGTGISSELFLKKGNLVYGVEPNDAMRAAAEQSLFCYLGFHSIKGTAEATGLPGRFADFVVAAQAFHWFDPALAKREFARVLKPGGHVVLIWNDRRIDASPFAQAYESLILEFATDYKRVSHKNVGEESIREFLGSYNVAHFENFQEFDFEGLLGRLTSSSYVPNEDHPRYAAMRSALAELFARHRANGVVRIEYDTQVFYN